MPGDPEAVAQLERLLGERRLADANRSHLAAAAEARFDRLVDGLLEEAAASDDVLDAAAARVFLERRLARFDGLLPPVLLARLQSALEAKIDSW